MNIIVLYILFGFAPFCVLVAYMDQVMFGRLNNTTHWKQWLPATFTECIMFLAGIAVGLLLLK